MGTVENDFLADGTDKADAFAAMQYELPCVPKSRSGYNFKYAPYETVMKYALPVMQKHGFSLRHCITRWNECWCVQTDLMLNGTQFETSYYPIGDRVGRDQDFGKSLTYGKRYNTVLLLGLSIEGEPDADDEKPKAQPVEVNF